MGEECRYKGRHKGQRDRGWEREERGSKESLDSSKSDGVEEKREEEGMKKGEERKRKEIRNGKEKGEEEEYRERSGDRGKRWWDGDQGGRKGGGG